MHESLPQVSCHPLVADLNREVDAWMAIIGKTMHDQAKQQAMLLNDAIADRRDKLSKPPEDLEALKSIVRLIGEIRESTPSMEDKFTVVEEQFRTLMLFEYPTEDAARELAMGIRQQVRVCVHPHFTRMHKFMLVCSCMDA
jgi:hypothetical protein